MNDKPLLLELFQFSEELELAQIRIAENYDILDQIIIVESCFDQCGNPKPYNFENNISLFDEWKDKITYYKIEDKPILRYSFDWSNEVYVRNCLANGLNKFYKEKNIIPNSSDRILFGDCDECVNNQALKEALELGADLISFTHLFNYCKLNYFAPARNWYGSILTNFSTFQEYGSFQELRKKKDHIEHFENKNYPSWHFSGVGINPFETAWNKYRTRVEPREKIPEELKNEYEKLFNKCVFEDKYFFFSDFPTRRDDDLKLDILPKYMLPSYVLKTWPKYKNLCLNYPEDNKEEQLNFNV